MKTPSLVVTSGVIKQYLALIEGVRLEDGDELSDETVSHYARFIRQRLEEGVPVPIPVYDLCVGQKPAKGRCAFYSTHMVGFRAATQRRRREAYIYLPLDGACCTLVDNQLQRIELVTETVDQTLRQALDLSEQGSRYCGNVLARPLEICLIERVNFTPFGLGQLGPSSLKGWIERARPSAGAPLRLITDPRFMDVATHLLQDYPEAIYPVFFPRGFCNHSLELPEEAGLVTAVRRQLGPRMGIRHTFVLCSQHTLKSVFRILSRFPQASGQVPRLPPSGTVFGLEWSQLSDLSQAIRFSLVGPHDSDEEE